MIHSRQQARKLLLTLICIELLFVVVYGTDAWIQGPAGSLHSLIDLDGEGNLPSWFSSFQLALITISFWVLSSRSRATQRPSRRFLRFCSSFFLLLAIDETAMLHERVTESLGSRYLDWVPAFLISHPFESAVCVLVIVAGLVGVYPHLRALWLMSPRSAKIGMLGAGIYVLGAAVLESIGYKMLSSGATPTLYRVEVATEEFFEMLGASLILYAVLSMSLRVPKSRSEKAAESRHRNAHWNYKSPAF
jgi:hypothetical protein